MTREQMLHLWRLMGQTWGAKFAEQYGPTPNEAWTLGLESVEPRAVKFALGTFIKGGAIFPPTLPEFLAVARKMPAPKPPADVRQLTHCSQISPERRQALRRQMYEALHGERLPENVQQRLAASPEDVTSEVHDAIRESLIR